MNWLKAHWKILAVAIGAGFVVWIVYRIVKDIEAGVTTAAKALASPFTAISSAVSGIFNSIASVFGGGVDTTNDPNLTAAQNAALNSAAAAQQAANGAPVGTIIPLSAPASLDNALGLDNATAGDYTMPTGGGY